MRRQFGASYVLAYVAFALMAGACGSENGDLPVVSSEGGVLSISLQALTNDTLFDDIDSARIVLYEAASAFGDEPVFESGCVGYGGDHFEIEDLSPGVDYTIIVDLYHASGCLGTDLALRGVRGGIEVEKKGNASSPYVIPTVAVDAFLPLPGQVDDHYPLNDSRGRVFHTATAVGDGRIVVVGGGEGIAGSDGDQIIGGSAIPEVFDSREMLFHRVPNNPMNSQRVMAHAAAALPDGRIAVAGGVSAVRMRISETTNGRRLNVDVPEYICYSTCDNPNFVFNLNLLDIDDGATQTLSLAAPRVFGSLDVVSAGGAQHLVLAGGVPGEKDFSGYDAFGWEIDSQGGLVNQGTRFLAEQRSGHASVCFRGSSEGGCRGLAYLGGVPAGTPYAEWMGDTTEEFSAATIDGAPLGSSVLLPGAAGVDGLMFVTGGVAGDDMSGVGRLPPAAIAMTTDGSGVYTLLDLGDGFPLAGELLFHTVTALPGRRVLITGGLDYDLRPTSRAFVVRADGGEFVLERTFNLNAARFGHTATVVDGGPFDGAVLILGGLTMNDGGGFELVTTNEMMLPSSSID